MKRKPSMRTTHNRKVKQVKHDLSTKKSWGILTDFSYSNTAGYWVDTGFKSGDIITISDSSDTISNINWHTYTTNSSNTIITNPKRRTAPSSVHPARRRKQIKRNKADKNSTVLTFSGGTLSCTKVDSDTWVIN